MHLKRARLLQAGKQQTGPVIYWMSRDQRVHDNWALIHALALAKTKRTYVAVVFSLSHEFLGANIRHFGFMLKGLRLVEAELEKLHIPFYLLNGSAERSIPNFVNEIQASALICDFDPLKIKRIWKREIAKKITTDFIEVDAHNIVPCLLVSQKEEFAAYTIRPKIHRLLPEFLDEFPTVNGQTGMTIQHAPAIDWDEVLRTLPVNRSIPEVSWILPGEEHAAECLENFLRTGIKNYNSMRNDPAKDGQSGLSPYLHFGHISAQRVALEVRKRLTPDENTENFLEELIVRRELADNFCYYNHKYDTFEGFQAWAKKTLNEHREDIREHIYTREELENSRTHDDLWNAAQREMVKTGKMHGYLRMYWAKKILEWSTDPDNALATAIYLNDTYQLDGRDPNGYTGCAWSIGGVHDRAWTERPVFGKIRYMNYAGCKRKFKIEQYIAKVN